MTTATDWPQGWRPARDKSELVRQLQTEVGRGHVLHGAHVRLLARRTDRDDALFALDDGRVAQVHLTWRPTAETNPVFPGTVIFNSLEEWLTSGGD